tara:strand:+ start:461 stop:886 length:426 start_codon:yes stop_codon:yes gene_type:complete
MKTIFAPFNLETMDQAISFKTTGDKVVTQVAYLSDASGDNYPIVGVMCGYTTSFTTNGDEYTNGSGCSLLMEVEDKLELPCLCYVTQYDDVQPCATMHTDIVLIKSLDKGSGYTDSVSGVSYLWKRVTPLTQNEIKDYLKN